jgi:hypothetical protein
MRKSAAKQLALNASSRTSLSGIYLILGLRSRTDTPVMYHKCKGQNFENQKPLEAKKVPGAV